MSMFPLPEEMMPKSENRDEMKRVVGTMPNEMAKAVNLMAHPLAGAAAMSALGAGVAGHAIGLWLGSLAHAVALSQRMLGQMPGDVPLSADSFCDQSRSPEVRAGEAVDALAVAVGSEAATRSSVPSEPARDVARSKVARARRETGRAGAAGMRGLTASGQDEKAPWAAFVSRRPASMERPAVPDDLKAVAGIGPKLEQVLNGFGLWTYGQLASLSGEEIAWVEEAVGLQGRIERDGWLERAAALAGARA